LIVDLTDYRFARLHTGRASALHYAELSDADLIAFARSGALGPRVDADPWAERHRPSAPARLTVVNSARA
jgi:hypothetical protein